MWKAHSGTSVPLPWVSWCYGKHLLLWHLTGSLTSESAGCPPLILHVLTTAIFTMQHSAYMTYRWWCLCWPKVYAMQSPKPAGLMLNLIFNFSKEMWLSRVFILKASPDQLQKSHHLHHGILGALIGDIQFAPLQRLVEADTTAILSRFSYNVLRALMHQYSLLFIACSHYIP